MDFLKNKGFTDEEINKIINKYNGSLDSFMFISDNVEDVIDYLDSYGIKNVAELMLQKIDMFYLPVDKIMELFSHYNREYIIESLEEDPAIFDELK
jgi:hypothetical protein